MTYEVVDLRPTYSLPSLGLSPLMIYRAHKSTSNDEAQTTKAMGQRDTT
jgi:hypothetical protein